MILVKVPLRISMFGGSTDYKSFYQDYGSFLIGTTINQYIYLSIRFRPKFFPQESLFVYSKMDSVKDHKDIHNPLIREILRYKNVKDYVEFSTFSDIPAKMGLGGSSAFCIGLLYAVNQLYGLSMDKKVLVKDAIKIERELLNDAGGIQDHIWPAYGGFNFIKIDNNGEFFVKPMPVTEDFTKEFDNNSLLIYTEERRDQKLVAQSYEGKDKKNILELSKLAYDYFIKEDIKEVGKLMYESWLIKRSLSNLISSSKIDNIIEQVMACGCYGAKLLGSGGSGFIYCICNSKVKEILLDKFKNNILNFRFEKNGIFSGIKELK